MFEIILSVLLCGVPVSCAGMLGTAALLTVTDAPYFCFRAGAVLPLLCGAFLAGFRAGKRIRRNGLRCGASAAFLLTLLWYAAVCIWIRRIGVPRLLLLTVPCGMLGGVLGVNTKLPLPQRHSHAASGVPRRLSLSCKAAAGKRRARRNPSKSGAEQPKNC